MISNSFLCLVVETPKMSTSAIKYGGNNNDATPILNSLFANFVILFLVFDIIEIDSKYIFLFPKQRIT